MRTRPPIVLPRPARPGAGPGRESAAGAHLPPPTSPAPCPPTTLHFPPVRPSADNPRRPRLSRPPSGCRSAPSPHPSARTPATRVVPGCSSPPAAISVATSCAEITTQTAGAPGGSSSGTSGRRRRHPAGDAPCRWAVPLAVRRAFRDFPVCGCSQSGSDGRRPPSVLTAGCGRHRERDGGGIPPPTAVIFPASRGFPGVRPVDGCRRVPRFRCGRHSRCRSMDARPVGWRRSLPGEARRWDSPSTAALLSGLASAGYGRPSARPESVVRRGRPKRSPVGEAERVAGP